MSREEIQRETLKILNWKAELEQTNRTLKEKLYQKGLSLKHTQTQLVDTTNQNESLKRELKQITSLKESLQDQLKDQKTKLRIIQIELKHVSKSQLSQKEFLHRCNIQKKTFENTLVHLQNKFESLDSVFHRDAENFEKKTKEHEVLFREAKVQFSKMKEEKNEMVKEHEELIRSKSNAIQDLTEKLKSLEKELQEIQLSEKSLQEESNKKDQCIENIQSSIRLREESMQETLDALNKEQRHVQDQIRREREKNQESENRLQSLLKDLETKENDVKSYEDRVQALELTMDEYEQERVHLNDQLSSQQNKIEELVKNKEETTTRIKVLTSELMDSNRQKEVIREEMKSFKINEIETLNERLNLLGTEKTGLESRIKIIEKECLTKDSLLQDLSIENEFKKSQIDQLELCIKDNDETLLRLEKDLNVLKEESFELKAKISEEELRNKEKENMLESLKRKIEENNFCISSHEVLIQLSKSKEEAFVANMERMEECLNIVNLEKGELVKKLEDSNELRATLLKIQEEKEHCEQAKASKEKEILALKELIQRMKNDFEEMKEETESQLNNQKALWKYSLDKAIELKESEAEDLKEREVKLAKESESLKSEMEGLKSKSEAELQDIVRAKDLEIQSLKDNVSLLQEEMQQLQLELSKEEEKDSSILRRSGRWIGGVRRGGTVLALNKEEPLGSNSPPHLSKRTREEKVGPSELGRTFTKPKTYGSRKRMKSLLDS